MASCFQTLTGPPASDAVRFELGLTCLRPPAGGPDSVSWLHHADDFTVSSVVFLPTSKPVGVGVLKIRSNQRL